MSQDLILLPNKEEITPHQILFSPKPFGTGGVIQYEMPANLTIREIVDLVPNKPVFWEERGLVIVDDVPWPKSCWDFRAQPGSRVLLSLQLSDPITTFIASIVLSAAVAATTSFLIPIVGTFMASLIAGGIGLLGSLAIGAFMKPDQAPQGPDSDFSVGAASMQGNVLPPGGRVPRAVGMRRLYPPIISTPFREVIEDDEFVECAFALAGPHFISNPRIGETLLEDDSRDIQYESRPGLPGDDPITILSRQGFERGLQIVLPTALTDPDSEDGEIVNQDDPWASLPTWTKMTSQDKPDEFWITLRWDEGLYHEDAPNRRMGQAVRIRFREVGTTTWHNAPEIHFRDRRAKLLRKTLRFMWGTMPGTAPTPAPLGGPWQAYREVPVQNVTPIGVGGWVAHSHFASGAGIRDTQNIKLFRDRVEFWLDPNTFPKGKYEFEVMASAAYNSNSDTFTPSTYSFTDGIYDLFGLQFVGGVWVFSVGGGNLTPRHYKISVLYNTSIWNEPPVPIVGQDALFALKVKNRPIESFSVEACGLVPDWDGTEWTGLHITNNPAAHLYDILTGNLNADPVPADLIDHASLVQWRQFCDDNNLEVHYAAEASAVDDAIAACVSAGHGIIRNSDTWGVSWERDRRAELPIQVFSERNSNNYQWSLLWDRVPDCLVVTYPDKLGENQQVIVLAEGVVVPKRTMEVTYAWIDNEPQAIAQAQLDLKLAYYRTVRYGLDVPAEGLVCQRGDLIGIQHDTLSKHSGRARIVEVFRSNGNITGVKLDSAIPVVNEDELFNEVADVNDEANVAMLGVTTGVTIRDSNGVLYTREVTDETADSTDIEFLVPIPDPGTIEFGNMVVSGPLTREYQRKIVLGMEMKRDLQLSLVLLDEAAAEIHGEL